MTLASSFVYWYITQSANSWVFRLVTLLLAWLVVGTATYAGLEVYRAVKPSERADRWCAEAFLVWASLLEGFLTCVALLYLLGARLILV